VGVAGQHHPCALLWRRRHQGRQSLRLQWSTILNVIMAWVLTLPAAIALSGSLFWIFRHTF
jgi:phosphate/sulfate permease